MDGTWLRSWMYRQQTWILCVAYMSCMLCVRVRDVARCCRPHAVSGFLLGVHADMSCLCVSDETLDELQATLKVLHDIQPKVQETGDDQFLASVTTHNMHADAATTWHHGLIRAFVRH